VIENRAHCKGTAAYIDTADIDQRFRSADRISYKCLTTYSLTQNRNARAVLAAVVHSRMT
jgi:hypothetical protein